MTLDEYQAEAMKTRQPNADLLYAAGKLHCEAGEVAQAVFKHVYHGRPLNTAHTAEELGDVLWYATEMAVEIGLSLEEIAAGNIAKLRRRHGEAYRPEFYTEAEAV